MTQLLNDVLLIGKAEAEKIECNHTLLNLGKICQDITEEMQASLVEIIQLLLQASGRVMMYLWMKNLYVI